MPRLGQGAELVNEALVALGIEGQRPSVIYAHINEIVAYLQRKNARATINITVTGWISERLCSFGLEAVIAGRNGGTFYRMPRHWKWIGDFYLQGEPFNTIISVKSFKAKERLLASGTGNLLSPAVGWGLFDDPSEFSYERIVSYAFRGFMAIYVPDSLTSDLDPEVLRFRNINGKRLMRNLSVFVRDFRNAMENGRLNPRLL